MVFIKTFRATTSDRVGLILLGRSGPAADPPKDGFAVANR
jgi:hypothetical protein